MTISHRNPSQRGVSKNFGTQRRDFRSCVSSYCYADATVVSTLPLAELPIGGAISDCAQVISVDLLNEAPPEPDVCRWLYRWPPERGGLSLRDDGDCFLLRFAGLADFILSKNGHDIGIWPLPQTKEETLRHLLLDQVLPRILAKGGKLILHAGAVMVSNQAIAFIGDTGRGKSTLTASFHTDGYPILSDDGLVLTPGDGLTFALPPYPSLRLWPESINGVYARVPALAPMAHYSAKQRVLMTDVEDRRIIASMPLAALYVLEPELEEDASAISLTQLSPRAACMAIIRNSFQLDPTNWRQAEEVFAAACQIAEHVPVFSFSYPRDFARLAEVREIIVDRSSQKDVRPQ